jgi:hypothetical protein
MAPKLGTARNVNRTSSLINRIVEGAGGGEGDEAILLNGLAILGYDPGLLQGFSDRDPERRFVSDAIVRAFRAGVSQTDIEKALKVGAYLAGRDIERNFEAVASLPPDQREAAKRAETQRPFAFKGEAPSAVSAPSATPAVAAPAAPRVLPGDVRAVERAAPAKPAAAPAAATAKSTPVARETTTTAAATDKSVIQPLRAGASEAEIQDYFRKNYGYGAWILDVPDLRAVLMQVATNPSGWTPTAVAGALSNTAWWRQNGQAVFDWSQAKANDPVASTQRLSQRMTQIRDSANRLGIELSDDRLRTMGEDSLRFNWDDRQIQSALGHEFHYSPQVNTGLAAQVRTRARDFLVPMTDEAYQSWGTSLASGDIDAAQYDEYLRNQAKSLFPTIGSFLDTGKTVRDWMDPYVAKAAQTLGISAEDIDLNADKWQRPLFQVDDKGQRTVMPLYDWVRTVKTDPTYGWDRTSNAREEAAAFAHQMLTSFGYT